MAWANDTKNKRDEQNRTRSVNMLFARVERGGASESDARSFFRFIVAVELLTESERCVPPACITRHYAIYMPLLALPEKRSGDGHVFMHKGHA